jgi:hypothetical protein
MWLTQKERDFKELSVAFVDITRPFLTDEEASLG